MSKSRRTWGLSVFRTPGKEEKANRRSHHSGQGSREAERWLSLCEMWSAGTRGQPHSGAQLFRSRGQMASQPPEQSGDPVFPAPRAGDGTLPQGADHPRRPGRHLDLSEKPQEKTNEKAGILLLDRDDHCKSLYRSHSLTIMASHSPHLGHRSVILLKKGSTTDQEPSEASHMW